MDDSTKKNTITNTNYFMRKIYFFLVLLFAVNGVWGQTATDGDYRTRATGALTWSGATTWQVRAASSWSNTATPPTSTANVYIQAGSNVTVDVPTADCNDLHITTTGVVGIGTNTIQVSGKVKPYRFALWII